MIQTYSAFFALLVLSEMQHFMTQIQIEVYFLLCEWNHYCLSRNIDSHGLPNADYNRHILSIHTSYFYACVKPFQATLRGIFLKETRNIKFSLNREKFSSIIPNNSFKIHRYSHYCHWLSIPPSDKSHKYLEICF